VTQSRKLRVEILGDSRGLAGALDESDSKLGHFGKAAALALGGVGAAAGALAAKSVMAFADFDRSMNEVFTLLPGVSRSAMNEMTNQVKDFSKEFGVLPEKVVPALYQSLSAGVPPDNVFAFLETAQKAAKGGVTELETAVDGLTSVVNAYGADVLSATQASDYMFTTVRMGKTTLDQLAQSLYNVTPTAAALGVSFGDVSAAMAAITLQGVPTSVATTQLRQLFVELSKETSKTAGTFEELAGKSFKDFVAGGGNVQQALQLLESHAAASGVGINDLFGSVEAGSAALALTGTGTEKFTAALAAMADSAGATDTAFHTMNKGIGPLIDKAKAFAAVWLIDVGDKIASVIEAISYGFTEMDVASDGLFGKLEGVGVGLRELANRAIAAWPTVRDGLMSVVAVVAANWPTIQAVVLDVLGKVVDFAQQNLPIIRSIVTDVFEGVSNAVSAALGIAKPLLDGLWTVFSVAAPVALGLVAAAAAAFKTLTKVLDNPVFRTVALVITAALVPALVKLGVQAAATGARTAFWWAVMQAEAIKATAATVAQFVIQGAQWAWMGVQATIHAAKIAAAWLVSMGPIALVVAAVVAAVVLIVKNWDTIVSAVSGAVAAVGRFLGDLVGKVVDFVKEWGVLLLGPIGVIWKFRDEIWGAVEAVGRFFGRLIGGVTSFAADWAWVLAGPIGAAWKFRDDIGVAIGGVVDWFFDLPGRIIGALGDIAGLLYGVGQAMVRGLIDGIKSLGGVVLNTLKDVVMSPVRGVKSLLGIRSPSVVFEGIGHNVMLGLIGGLHAEEARLADQLKHIAGMVTLTPGGIGGASGGIGGASGGISPGVIPASAAGIGASTGGIGGTAVSLRLDLGGGVLIVEQAAVDELVRKLGPAIVTELHRQDLSRGGLPIRAVGGG
jgi:TP901 family phage tail tape measure protein